MLEGGSLKCIEELSAERRFCWWEDGRQLLRVLGSHKSQLLPHPRIPAKLKSS